MRKKQFQNRISQMLYKPVKRSKEGGKDDDKKSFLSKELEKMDEEIDKVIKEFLRP